MLTAGLFFREIKRRVCLLAHRFSGSGKGCWKEGGAIFSVDADRRMSPIGNGGTVIAQRSDGDLRSTPIWAVRAIIPPAGAKNGEIEAEDEEANSSSSSIGRNSDCSDGSADDDPAEEVESVPRGPLDTTGSLEEALPLRRGISKFYTGKSKSFTSFAEVSSSSCKELAKPENAYTRKRKNLLAFSINWERRHSLAPANSTTKRAANSARPPPHPYAPRHCSPSPRCHFSARSLSLADLQSASDSSQHLSLN
ncbi:uncharacterized protein LOC144704324 isoform X2 [Wolffia australiana]